MKMTYKIRTWYGQGGPESFGGEVYFDVSNAMLGLENLRKKLAEVNAQFEAFTTQLQQFNQQIATINNLPNLIAQLQQLVTQQGEVGKATSEANKEMLNADAIIDERKGQILDVTNALDKQLEVRRQSTRLLTEEGNLLTVVADAQGNLLRAREREVQATQAQVRQQERLAAQREQAQQRYDEIQNKLAQGLLTVTSRQEKFNTSTGKMQEVIRGITQDGERFQATYTRLGGNLVQVSDNIQTLSQNTEEAKKRVQELTLSWQSMIRIVTVQTLHRAVSLFIREVREAIEVAKEFTIRIAEIRTISQNNQLTTQEWGEGLRQLSDAFGLDLLDQAEAAYQTLSNQVAEGAETLTFLEQANRLALVGVSDSTSAVQLLTAVINSFNLQLDDTSDIAAKTFKTIELGRVRLEEMSQTIGITAVPAANLGLTFNDLAAAITTVTIRGVPFEKAQTLIRNILLKLIRPTKEMQKFFEELGVTSGETAIQTYGFAELLARLEERTQGSSDELGKLFGRIRAISGAMIFAGEGLETFERNWEELQNAQESYREATRETMENVGREINIEIEKIKNYFIQDYGQTLLQIVADTTRELGGLSGIVKAFAEALTGLLIPATVLATAAMAKWALSIHPIATAIIAIGTTLRFVLDDYVREIEENEKEQERIRLAAIERRKREYEDLTRATRQFYDDQIKLVLRATATIQAENTRIIREQTKLDKIIVRNLRTAYQEVIKSINAGIKELEKTIRESEKIIDTTARNIETLSREFTKQQFEFQLEGVDELAKQIDLIEDRINLLRTQAQAQIAVGGDQVAENVREIYKEIDNLLRQQAEIRREADKTSIESARDLEQINKKIESEQTKARERELKFRRQIREEAQRSQQTVRIRTTREGEFEVLTRNRKVLEIDQKRQRIAQESEDRIKELLKDRTDLVNQQKDAVEVAEKQIDIQKEQNRLIRERIDFEKQLQIEAQQKRQEAEKEARETRKALTEIQQEYIDIAAISIRNILGTDDLEKQQKKLEDAINEIEEFQTKIQENQRIIDFDDRIRLESEIIKRREQLETLLDANIRNQDLKRVRDEAKEQEKIFQQRIKQQEKLNEQERLRVTGLEDAFRQFGASIVDKFGRFSQTGDIDVSQEIQTFIDSPSFDNLAKITEKLYKVQELNLGGYDRLTNEINLFIKTGESLIEEEQKRLQAIDNINKAQEDAIKQFQSTEERLLKLAPQQEKRDIARNNSLQTHTTLMNQMIITLEEINKSIQESRGVTPQQFGGRIGTDSIPALLSPGEFVMNAQATRRFYSQLVAMNAAVPGFQSGGMVTNVGDVNITMQSSGNEAYDAAKLGRILRRGIRQGTIKLN